MTPPIQAESRPLIIGYGLHGQAVAAALAHRGVEVVVVDDQPSAAVIEHALAAGIELVGSPDDQKLADLVSRSTHLLPTPGLGDDHDVFGHAAERGVAVIGELDLASQWDDRPVLAVTGTNGKTTVTTLVAEMLTDSGRHVVAAGNMELALVAAIDDPHPEMFVVEASSFRLGHSNSFSPRVATWLNFEPDHLDVHASLDSYEAAKARIWKNLTSEDLAIANIDDTTVMRNVPTDTPLRSFGGGEADARVIGGELTVAGTPIVALEEMHRDLPHDVSNALAAAATALGGGATVEGTANALRSFAGLSHRLELVAEAKGVQWYNDSKATTPHAVLAGLRGFDSVVLIAGGRNKGVDLAPLAQLGPRLRAVVAIGEAADEVRSVLEPHAKVICAESMEDAVQIASRAALQDDVVALSPACTSYDWYRSYAARGEEFSDLVRSLVKAQR